VLRTVARDDDAIARDVRGHLSAAGRRRWEVAVTDGVVTLASDGADETDRHIATVVAGCAPGVVHVRIRDEVARHAGR
jgi:osmotically-inducible protein OsmY